MITFLTVGLGDYAPPFFNPGRPDWFQAAGYFMGAVLILCSIAQFSTLLGAIEAWVRKHMNMRRFLNAKVNGVLSPTASRRFTTFSSGSFSRKTASSPPGCETTRSVSESPDETKEPRDIKGISESE